MSLQQKAEITYADQTILLKNSGYSRHLPPLLTAEYYSSQTQTVYNIKSPLSGKYQLKNLAAVISTFENLQQSGIHIKADIITKGIRKVIKNTHLMGRWQVLKRNPLTIADIGHNPDGIREVLEQVKITPYKKLHFVLGVVNDKDVRSMLGKLPVEATYYFCKADIPRGLDATELAKQADEFALKGSVYNCVKDAFDAATKSAGPNDLVIIGGSAFVVAEVV